MELRLSALIDRLRRFYGALPVPPSQPFALYVWEVLSRNTTPARRDSAFAALKRLRTLTPDALGRVPQAKLESAIAHAGTMKDERIRALRAGAQLFRKNPDLDDALAGPLPIARRAVRLLPDLGRTASARFLLFAAGHPIVALDEHGLRVARRLGFARGGRTTLTTEDENLGPPPIRTQRHVRRVLTLEVAADLNAARQTSLYLIHHGLTTCTAVAPHCAICPLALDCEWLRLQ
jgi:endonuclease III